MANGDGEIGFDGEARFVTGFEVDWMIPGLKRIVVHPHIFVGDGDGEVARWKSKSQKSKKKYRSFAFQSHQVTAIENLCYPPPPHFG